MTERLKRVITELGLNQQKLGESVGVTPAQVSRWISGDSEMPQSTAMAFQAALGIRWQWLLHGEGEMLLSRPDHLSDAESQILENFRTLSPELQKEVYNFSEFTRGKQEAQRDKKKK